jgi:hypothetical protein
MKTYSITIRATITKTLRVEADNEDDAIMMAHEEFSVLNDHNDENYMEDLLDITEGESK